MRDSWRGIVTLELLLGQRSRLNCRRLNEAVTLTGAIDEPLCGRIAKSDLLVRLRPDIRRRYGLREANARIGAARASYFDHQPDRRGGTASASLSGLSLNRDREAGVFCH